MSIIETQIVQKASKGNLPSSKIAHKTFLPKICNGHQKTTVFQYVNFISGSINLELNIPSQYLDFRAVNVFPPQMLRLYSNHLPFILFNRL